jgi:hypothetical protein
MLFFILRTAGCDRGGLGLTKSKSGNESWDVTMVVGVECAPRRCVNCKLWEIRGDETDESDGGGEQAVRDVIRRIE